MLCRPAAFGAGGLKRVAFPLVALALVVVLRRVLEDLEVPHLSLLAPIGLATLKGAGHPTAVIRSIFRTKAALCW